MNALPSMFNHDRTHATAHEGYERSHRAQGCCLLLKVPEEIIDAAGLFVLSRF